MLSLGTHFTGIADKEEEQKQKQTSVADPEVNKLLQDEQVRQLLLDPDVVQLMKCLREQPDRAQWFEEILFRIFQISIDILFFHRIMRTADGTMRKKIQRLINLGLLSVA